MNKEPIGILDSGFGGLSIYQSITKLLPHESTIYIGDQAQIPYSGKTPQFIQERVIKLIRFFLSQNVKLVVIACNTATVAGIEMYRRMFPDLPIIGVVPVIKTAAEISKKKSFAVLSTNFTARSEYQKNLIRTFASDCTVFNLGGHSLVDFVERGVIDGNVINRDLQKILTPHILRDIDVLVLGCTHYPFLRNTIRTIAGNGVQILDSGGAVARQAARILQHNKILSDGDRQTHQFYSTENNVNFSHVATQLLGKKVTVHYEHI